MFNSIIYPDHSLSLNSPACLKNLSLIDLKNDGKIMNIISKQDDNLNEALKPTEDFPISGDYPSCVFLGTSSSCPSKYRNVSSILVSFHETTSVLLDCGESTLSQLCYRFPTNADIVISSIKLIFISHIHADHHLGLISLIKSINRFQEVTILAQCEIIDFLSYYHTFVSRINFKSIILNSLTPDFLVPSNNIKITCIPVDHSIEAYGIRLDHLGKSVVYSGDTAYCLNLVNYGFNLFFYLIKHKFKINEKNIYKAFSTNFTNKKPLFLRTAYKLNL
uniref:ribonuclease Z n=1 Tax=Myxobolus squamalis TaxID=59785 RepID=A0A6B2FXG6_MYXSQ